MANEKETWEHVEDDNFQRKDEEMDGAEKFIELTDSVFDEVLQQCKREKQTHTISPQ